MPDYSQLEQGEIIEPEEWRNPEEQQFNHQALVMTAMRKCLELGSTELREGWWEEKVDKFGNIHKAYHEDTRKCFIESVKSAMMLMNCDYDEDAKKKIPKLLASIKERKDYWLKEEWEWWIGLSNALKNQMTKEGKNVIKGFFNSKLDFDNYFFQEETDLYRDICTELNDLTARLDFYGAIGYIGR